MPRQRLPNFNRLLFGRERQFMESFLAEEEGRQGLAIEWDEFSEEQSKVARRLRDCGYLSYHPDIGWETTSLGRMALNVWERKP